MDYAVKFTRYDDRTGERRISSPVFMNAGKFDTVVDRARDWLRGMQEADRGRQYEIDTIAARNQGSRLVVCDGCDVNIWETNEEFVARIDEEGRAKA